VNEWMSEKAKSRVKRTVAKVARPINAALACMYVAFVSNFPSQRPRDPRPTTGVRVPGGAIVEGLYDTGSVSTLMSEEAFRRIPVDMRPQKKPVWNPDLLGAGQNPLDVRGVFDMDIEILGRKFPQQEVVVIRNLSSDVFIGHDFIEEHGLSYDAIGKELYFDQRRSWAESALITSKELVVPARSDRRLHCRTNGQPGQPVNGPALTVSSVTCSSYPIHGVDQLVSVDNDGICSLVVHNLTDVEIRIPRNTYIGSVEKVKASELQRVELDMNAPPLSEPPPLGRKKDPEKMTYLEKVTREKLGHLSPELQDRYVNLILRNEDVFSKDKFDLGKVNCMSHKIYMKDDEPVYRKQFRIPEADRQILIEHLNNWIKLGVVSPSNSRYNSPIFLVPKKDGTGRPVLDFRGVNDKSMVDKYSQREVQDCIDELGRSKSKVFSACDMTAGFW